VENEVFIYERNPYYYKVDSEGNQLPYLDRIIAPKVQDGEMENMVMIAGEADILRRNAALIRMPLYKQNETAGNYHTLILNSHLDAPSTLTFNYSYGDIDIREMMLDYRFRKAVSLGIDKQEIIDTVYLGFGTIPVRVPAEFDPLEANNLLDQMGMTIGANGFRNHPGGAPFKFMIETSGAAIDLLPASEIVAAHLREYLAIDAEIRLNDPAVHSQLNTDNLIMSTVQWTFDQMTDSEYAHRWFTAGPSVFGSNYMRAKIEGRSTDGENMVEPPQWIQDGFEIYSRFINAVYGSVDYVNINNEAARYYHDNIAGIPLIENSVLPIPISNRFGNVPTGGYQICVLMATEILYDK